jgi:hypothetical protein
MHPIEIKLISAEEEAVSVSDATDTYIRKCGSSHRSARMALVNLILGGSGAGRTWARSRCSVNAASVTSDGIRPPSKSCQSIPSAQFAKSGPADSKLALLDVMVEVFVVAVVFGGGSGARYARARGSSSSKTLVWMKV